MFGRLRLQLTLWYVGILALTLIGVGVLVYVLVARSLDQQINDALQEVNSQAAQVLAGRAQSGDNEDAGGEREGGGTDEDDEYRDVLNDGQFGGTGDVSLLVLDSARNLVANPAGIDVAGLPLGSLTPGEFKDTSVNGDSVRVYATNVYGDDGTVEGLIVTIKPLAHRDDDLQRLLLLLIVAGAAGLLIAGAGGLWVAQLAVAPVRRSYQRQREFIADASHELRSPLAVVRANAEALLVGAAPAQTEPLEDIVAETELMGRLVSDLLTLAKADRTELELHQEQVDLLAIATSAVRGIQQLTTERGVAVRVSGENVTLYADSDRLRELLFVLLDNAVRYTPPGGQVNVETRRTRHAVELVVEDTGPGIPKEDQPHVFERFYRVDKARSREEGGLGLGLAIAQAIAQAHGGTIGIESAPGQGVRVTVRFPDGSPAGSEQTTTQAPARGPSL